MVFSDLLFLFVYLPVFIVGYLLAAWFDKKVLITDRLKPCMTTRNIVLMLFSLVFYSWGEPVYIFLMLICVLVNYLSGIGIAHFKGKGRKVSFWTGLVLDLGILATFKYLGFFADSLGMAGVTLDVPRLALPIGISFYTFQSISYLIDVYRREQKALYNYFDLLLYIAMFPQLIAGPIVRFGTVAKEIHSRTVSAQDVAEGSYRFIVGLTKKVIVANIMSEVVDLFLRDGLDTLSTPGAWIGIIAFTLQIYFDFSGYSDMAIGIGRSLGFHFNENFNHPYVSRSITDFWRRWHMSLGSFFRDYVYIPMGGGRRRRVLNILTVWFLTGMWHGASWNFIIWGLYFGLILMIEKQFLLPYAEKIPRLLLHCYALFLIVVGWGIFYFDDLSRMGRFYRILFGCSGNPAGIVEHTALTDNFWIWIAALLLCIPLRGWVDDRLDRMVGSGGTYAQGGIAVGRALLCGVLLLCCVAMLVGATNNPFIYTRF